MDEVAIAEMFQVLGPVTVRRMFGGKGIYHAGRILALEVDGEMLLKADDRSAPAFSAAGCRQWAYCRRQGGAPVRMPYWSVPEEAFDDPDIMALWVRRAWEAALRTASGGLR
ncbi:TfoX/Sxy family protein [Shinella daejeonensis]|uniref:TfoX/Sxy family protein n=1 Tax=Shinella daejeonensis TaxID=659017 RepID=UPI0020C7D7B1|nr:TfoX/Sxy family protein [Shinella daejeonensis]MCP8893544.1 TfoX/Sxy family protein [Shinella daejeonensis]